jgi:hypothetical protein
MKNKKMPTILLPVATAIILLCGLLTPAYSETYSKEYAFITYSSFDLLTINLMMELIVLVY